MVTKPSQPARKVLRRLKERAARLLLGGAVRSGAVGASCSAGVALPGKVIHGDVTLRVYRARSSTYRARLFPRGPLVDDTSGPYQGTYPTMTDTAINDTRKAELLSTEVEHIDITSFDARPIIEAMGKMSFTSRDLARATRIYNQMLEDKDCTVFLVIAGSTSAGGCMDAYAELVRNNMVDGIVATGATIVDMDFFEGLGHKHYQALEIPDDDTLRSLYIDRIYDTYIDEEDLQNVDHTIFEIAETLETRPYSSREFIKAMGKYLVEHGKKDNSLVKLAYEHDVPIFCPAFTDSSAGFGLVKHQVDAMKAGRPYMSIDSVADFRELTDIKVAAGSTGLLMIGGGVPKNFIQDTVVCAEILGHEDVAVHQYAVQITVADVRDGACSSSTLQEAASWGKVNTGIEQMVFAEAGSVLPLLASDAYHRGAWKNRSPRKWAQLFK